ncbi:hypothetical protein [Desulfovibrio aminophilus]|uniref:hypothetical protein n=1 Tax=Desulfovibrio aminophilus TaxID=81425 RepID=UPI00339A5ACC
MNFGFLMNSAKVNFYDAEIITLPIYTQLIERVRSELDVAGGWIYPPLVSVDDKRNLCEKLQFKKNGPMVQEKYFTLPATHSITFADGHQDDEFQRFLILGYGFLFGLYLLPENYLYFCKIPHNSLILHPLIAGKNDCEIGIMKIYQFYKSSKSEDRKQMFAILHWFLMGQTYDMEWDRFDAQYKVMDGLYRLARSKKIIKKAPFHASRPVFMAEKFGIQLPSWAVLDPKGKSELSEMRNRLYHEAIFAGKPIGYECPKNNYSLEFPNFNLKMICKMLGLNTKYINVPPGDRQVHAWDLIP